MPSASSDVERWTAALFDRHLGPYSREELLKAVRALSARYVEQRGQLDGRSPLDSAGKRAAFAILYGPLHYVTIRSIVDRLGLGDRQIATLVDLGCGTGAASAAWAGAQAAAPMLRGVDRSGWAIGEARWTWRVLGLDGHAVRGDLVGSAARLEIAPRRTIASTGVLAAWSVNELPAASRERLLPHLLAAGQRGATVLVVEPIATRVAPWWGEWSRAVTEAGGRADTWQVPNTLPETIQRLDRDAGFDRQQLTARSLALVR